MCCRGIQPFERGFRCASHHRIRVIQPSGNGGGGPCRIELGQHRDRVTAHLPFFALQPGQQGNRRRGAVELDQRFGQHKAHIIRCIRLAKQPDQRIHRIGIPNLAERACRAHNLTQIAAVQHPDQAGDILLRDQVVQPLLTL